MSESKKSGKIMYYVLALVVLLCLAGFLLVNYGNPQWHPSLYAYRAKNAPDNVLEPSGSYTGPWSNWGQDGKLRSTYQYRNGKKDGPYTTYNSAGGVLSEGQFKNGELDGLQKVQMEDGSRTEIPYAEGKRHGMERSWYPTGELAVEAPFVDGEQEGSVTYYYQSGAVHSSIPYYRGKREGVHKTFYENGAPQGDEYYRDDILNGKSEFLHPDGTPDMALNYRDGRMDGVQVWYHPNGKKAREIVMSMGMPNGRWQEWDEDGTQTADEEYDMGELVKPPEKKPEEKAEDKSSDAKDDAKDEPENKPENKPENEPEGEAVKRVTVTRPGTQSSRRGT